MTRAALRSLLLLVLSSFFFAGCAAQLASSESEREGLATTWGETRESKVERVSFDRHADSAPDLTAELRYNDKAGIDAVVGRGSERKEKPILLAGGNIEVALVDGEGGWFGDEYLARVEKGEKHYVEGVKGERYRIAVRNTSRSRVEVVASVDGLDVIDGEPASFAKRGYIVDPGKQLFIDGFRRSSNEVAAFRFGGVLDSYAQVKHGNATNAGVVGFAFFRERGSPSLIASEEEIRRREQANPFPGRFATPPETP